MRTRQFCSMQWEFCNVGEHKAFPIELLSLTLISWQSASHFGTWSLSTGNKLLKRDNQSSKTPTNCHLKQQTYTVLIDKEKAKTIKTRQTIVWLISVALSCDFHPAPLGWQHWKRWSYVSLCLWQVGQSMVYLTGTYLWINIPTGSIWCSIFTRNDWDNWDRPTAIVWLSQSTSSKAWSVIPVCSWIPSLMALVRRISQAITLCLDTSIVFPLIKSCALTPGINCTWSAKVETPVYLPLYSIFAPCLSLFLDSHSI
jgi:hypothetical protein